MKNQVNSHVLYIIVINNEKWHRKPIILYGIIFLKDPNIILFKKPFPMSFSFLQTAFSATAIPPFHDPPLFPFLWMLHCWIFFPPSDRVSCAQPHHKRHFSISASRSRLCQPLLQSLILFVLSSYNMPSSFNDSIHTKTPSPKVKTPTPHPSSSAKLKFHPALVISKIRKNIHIVLDMETDRYDTYAELFHIHVCSHRVMHHIMPSDDKLPPLVTNPTYD